MQPVQLVLCASSCFVVVAVGVVAAYLASRHGLFYRGATPPNRPPDTTSVPGVDTSCTKPVCVGKNMVMCSAYDATDKGYATFAQGRCVNNPRKPWKLIKQCAATASWMPKCIDGVYEFNNSSEFACYEGLDSSKAKEGPCPANRTPRDLSCHGNVGKAGPVCADGMYTAPNECLARTMYDWDVPNAPLVKNVSTGACPAATAWTCTRECPTELCWIRCGNEMRREDVTPATVPQVPCERVCPEPACYIKCTRNGQSVRSNGFAP